MTIQFLKNVPREELAGKFICSPSRYNELAYGWPARIEKATAARLTYRCLPRGAWDPAESEWQVRVAPVPPASASDDRASDIFGLQVDESTEQCLSSSVQFVCDTAQEAVALYTQALSTQKLIMGVRKTALSVLDHKALAGELPAPAYLAAQQA